MSKELPNRGNPSSRKPLTKSQSSQLRRWSKQNTPQPYIPPADYHSTLDKVTPQPNTIQEILDDLIYQIEPDGEGHSQYDDPEEQDTATISARQQATQAITNYILKEIIGDDFRHSNGKKMVNPAYECDECGEPDPEWTINKVLQAQRAKLGVADGTN